MFGAQTVILYCEVNHNYVCVYAFYSDIALKECPAYKDTSNKVEVYEEVDVDNDYPYEN